MLGSSPCATHPAVLPLNAPSTHRQAMILRVEGAIHGLTSGSLRRRKKNLPGLGVTKNKIMLNERFCPVCVAKNLELRPPSPCWSRKSKHATSSTHGNVIGSGRVAAAFPRRGRGCSWLVRGCVIVVGRTVRKRFDDALGTITWMTSKRGVPRVQICHDTETWFYIPEEQGCHANRHTARFGSIIVCHVNRHESYTRGRSLHWQQVSQHRLPKICYGEE
jgi:hypothetical protein